MRFSLCSFRYPQKVAVTWFPSSLRQSWFSPEVPINTGAPLLDWVGCLPSPASSLLCGPQTSTHIIGLGSGPPSPLAYFEADTFGRGANGTATSLLASASAVTSVRDWSPAPCVAGIARRMVWLSQVTGSRFANMPWSNTRLGSRRLALAATRLLPSQNAKLLGSQKDQDFGAGLHGLRACVPTHRRNSGARLATDLLARLWTDGNLTRGAINRVSGRYRYDLPF